MKEYILKPIMTPQTVSLTTSFDKPATLKIVPPRQPLPTAIIDPGKPLLKLGLDVHLEFIMAVAQKGHTNPQAPRKFTREQLVAQVRKWVAEGFQVFCVQESCGFGFVLHRELVAAGAQSFLITPIALNGQRKTDKLDARALCLRLSRWLDGNRDELAPIRIPSETEQRQREGTRRRKFLAGAIRSLANRGHSQVAEYCHAQLPHRWWGPRNWLKLATLDPWVLGVLAKLRELILGLEGATGRTRSRTVRPCERSGHAQGPGWHDAGDARRRGVQLESLQQPQTGRQLHRVLSRRTQFGQ